MLIIEKQEEQRKEVKPYQGHTIDLHGKNDSD